MKTFVMLVMLALLECSQAGFAAEPGAPTPEQAVQRLLAAKFFAFGGVGFTGATSEGESAFRAVAVSTNALPLFKAALTNDNPVARLYALTGIRKLEPRSFERLAKALLDSNPKVTTMSGCMVTEEPAADVLTRIKGGYYDAFRTGGNISK